MQVELKSSKGEVIKKISASDEIWKLPFNDVLVHQVVVAQLSNKRQGTSNTLRRKDASYSTAKLRNQKGAGRARVGSRSSHVLGNSVAHGPHPRSHKKKILKKVKNASIKMALSEKMREGTITVIDKLNTKDISTKKFNKMIQDLELPKKSCMLLEKSEINENVIKSSSNIPGILTVQADLINTYDLLNTNHLLITQEGFKKIEEIWGSNKRAKK
tara:strand:- start:5148 stop:5792 length:645 start_codon:yes stop_codon:yes gene_type:complete